MRLRFVDFQLTDLWRVKISC